MILGSRSAVCPHRPEAQDVALSRPRRGFESRWGRHTKFGAAASVKLLENQAGYGGSKFLAVKLKPFGEQDLLKPLFLNEIKLGRGGMPHRHDRGARASAERRPPT